MIEIVPATKEILDEHYGKELPRSCRAIAAVKDGRVLGVAGFHMDKIAMVVFSELSDELKRSPRALIKGWRLLAKMMRARGVMAYARCDSNIEAAERFLIHLGFERMAGDIFGVKP